MVKTTRQIWFRAHVEMARAWLYACMVRQLILHVGMPKTATTSLQTHLFSSLPGFLGKSHAPEPFFSTRVSTPHFKSELLAAFVTAYIAGVDVDGHRSYGREGQETWRPALRAWVSNLLNSPEDTVLVSYESFMGWRSPLGNAAIWPVMDEADALPRRGRHPVLHFLTYLRELLPANVDLKTILVLRNQSDWLCSLAAQVGIANTKFVDRLIDTDDAFLDYSTIVKGFMNLRGRSSHLTLLHENGLHVNAEKILQFCDYVVPSLSTEVTSWKNENVRRDSSGGWRVHEEIPLERFATRVSSLIHNLRLDFVRPALKPILGHRVREKFHVRQPGTISLTSEQHWKIREHCYESNLELSDVLRLDLSQFGY